MKKLFILLILFSSFCYAQRDTTIVRSKVVKLSEKFYIEEVTTSTRYREFNIALIQEIDNKDTEEIEEQNEISRRNKELAEKRAQKREFQKYLRDAIKQGYKSNINNSFEQEIYQKVLNKIKQ